MLAYFKSSTRTIPEFGDVPRHVAIIMDGNGRWAKKRFLPRFAGHSKGVETVREAVRHCIGRGIGYLTLFAFSSENWRRPAEEVSLLMQLFARALMQEVSKLNENGVRLRIVGDLARFDPSLQDLIRDAERITAGNTRLTLTIAANYGGRWDIVQAMNRMAAEHPENAGRWTEDDLVPWLAMSHAPEPDLFIRTGGEKRISNFLLWQLAYTEFYFTDTYWPEFDSAAFDEAIASYRQRERRFGRTSEQLLASEDGKLLKFVCDKTVDINPKDYWGEIIQLTFLNVKHEYLSITRLPYEDQVYIEHNDQTNFLYTFYKDMKFDFSGKILKINVSNPKKGNLPNRFVVEILQFPENELKPVLESILDTPCNFHSPK